MLGPLPIALLLAACQTPMSEAEQARRLQAALAEAPSSPERAAGLCLSLPEGPNRGSCAWGVVERIGAEQPALATSLCQELSGFRKDECFFALARAAEQVSLCAQAGSYALDCERNVFASDLERWLDAEPRPGALEPEVLAALERFRVDDEREALWEEVYTAALLRAPTPARADCEPVQAPELREICRHVAERHLRNQVALAQERGQLFCHGGLPHTLRDFEDPLVAELVAQARASGACTPGVTPERRPKKASSRGG